MAVIYYSATSGNLAKTMQKACDDHDPVVMLSLMDYEALSETAYLLQSPKNSQRLTKSIRELDSGKGKARILLESSVK